MIHPPSAERTRADSRRLSGRRYVKLAASFSRLASDCGSGALLGYARVSKGDEQNNALQAKAVRAAGCRSLIEEAAAGGLWDRPELPDY
jgi:hypothetical protein